jgi:hypothetical protein
LGNGSPVNRWCSNQDMAAGGKPAAGAVGRLGEQSCGVGKAGGAIEGKGLRVPGLSRRGFGTGQAEELEQAHALAAIRLASF